MFSWFLSLFKFIFSRFINLFKEVEINNETQINFRTVEWTFSFCQFVARCLNCLVYYIIYSFCSHLTPSNYPLELYSFVFRSCTSLPLLLLPLQLAIYQLQLLNPPSTHFYLFALPVFSFSFSRFLSPSLNYASLKTHLIIALSPRAFPCSFSIIK